MKNAIVIISIGRDSYLEYCYPTVQAYCDRYELALEVIREPEYALPKSTSYNYLTFEKNQTYKYFDQYDRILRLDSDIIINPSAPNYFDSDPTYVYVSFEDVGTRKADRRKQIDTIKSSLGDIPEWTEGYFNSGVVLSSKQHRSMYDISGIDFDKDLGDFKEQNVLNWKVHKDGFEVKDLGKDFNHTRIYEESWCRSNRLEANIIHYAGPQNGKREKMLYDYKYFYEKR